MGGHPLTSFFLPALMALAAITDATGPQGSPLALTAQGVSLASLRGTLMPELSFAGQRYQLAICEPVHLAQHMCSATSPGGDVPSVLANASFLLHNGHGGCTALGDVHSMEAMAIQNGGDRALVVRYRRGNRIVSITFSPGTSSRPTNLTETARGHWSLRWDALQADQLIPDALRAPLQPIKTGSAPVCEVEFGKARFRDPNDPTCVPLYAQFVTANVSGVEEQYARCTIMSWKFTEDPAESIGKLLLQGVLFCLSLGSLILKKKIEDRQRQEHDEQDLPRDQQEFYLDIAKQGIAEFFAHVLHFCTSLYFHSKFEMYISNACAWYFITYTVDTVAGTFLSICLLKLATRGLLGCSSMRRLGEYRRLHAGEDGGAEQLNGWGGIDWCLWAKQTAIWSAFVLGTRLLLFALIFILHKQCGALSEAIALWFVCAQQILLTLVTLVCPTVMNIVQLQIQDTYLRGRSMEHRGVDHRGTRASRSPGRLPRVPLDEGEQEEDWETVRTGVSELSENKYELARRRCCNLLLVVVFISVFAAIGVTLYDATHKDYYFEPCSSHIDWQAKDFNKRSVMLSGHKHDFDYAFREGCPIAPSPAKESKLQDLSIKAITEHRPDLLRDKQCDDHSYDSGCNTYKAKPKCICCNQREQSDFDMQCAVKKRNDVNTQTTTTEIECGSIQTSACCGSVKLGDNIFSKGAQNLNKTCAICPLYFPCDQEYCPARSEEIRSAQHTPMVFGALFSLCANVYVVYTYAFDEQVRRATVATLLASAAVVAIIFTSAILIQEFLFRIPTEPCFPSSLKSVFNTPQDECSHADHITGWPTWQQVENARAASFGGRGQAVNNCRIMSFIVQFTWTASDGFYFMVAVDMMLDLFTSPFGSSRKRMWWYQGIVFALSCGTATALLVGGQWGVHENSILEDFCWSINFGHQSSEFWSWGLVYGVTIFCYVMSIFAAVVAHRKAQSLTQGMREARKHTIQSAACVAVAGAVWTGFMAGLYWTWILPTSAKIAEELNVTRLTDPDAINYGNAPRDYTKSAHTTAVRTFAFVVGWHNVINFLIFRILVIPDLNPIAYKFFGGVQLAADQYDNTVIQLNHHLQNELLYFTGLGIRSVCRWQRHIVSHEYPETAHIHERSTMTSLFRETATSLQQPLLPSSEDEFQARPEHRMIQVNLVKANQTENRLSADLNAAQISDGRTSKLDFKRNMDGLFRGMRSNDLQRPEEELRGQDVQVLERENYLQNKQLGKITFRSYVPAKFRELRELFGIDIHGSDGHGALHEAMAQHKQGSFDGGASGAFMYSSNDGRFIVKQITQNELLVLLNMLDDYIRHFRSPIENGILEEQITRREIGQQEAELQPRRDQLERWTVHRLLAEADRLELTEKDADGRRIEWGLQSYLPRLLQCNRIQMYHTETRYCQGVLKGGRIYFVVMENTFHKHVMREVAARMRARTRYVPEDEISRDAIREEVEAGITKFDLKGSSVNRSTMPSDAEDAARLEESTTLKDLDLRETLYMSEDDKQDLVEQLRKDTKFLCDHNIMDYSLLLGIQKGLNPKKRLYTSAFDQQPQHGQLTAVAAHSAQSYYVGIIDILQQWDWWKSWEPWAKSVCGPLQYQNFDAYELSAVDPKYYRKRFIVRLKRHIEATALEEVPQQSVADIVDAITPNLQLNEDQRGLLTERLEVTAGSGDVLNALMATNDDIQGLRRRRSGQNGKRYLSVGGGAHRCLPEPEPEAQAELELEPEPEPELELLVGPNIGASRSVSPTRSIGGSE